MSITTRTTITTSPSISTETTTQLPSKRYSIRTNEKPEREPQATRSKDSHLCITIRRSAPACGRRGTRRVTVDRVAARFEIIDLETASGVRPLWC